jgi:hypothetical protein
MRGELDMQNFELLGIVCWVIFTGPVMALGAKHLFYRSGQNELQRQTVGQQVWINHMIKLNQ